jgi:hypothetical protein
VTSQVLKTELGQAVSNHYCFRSTQSFTAAAPDSIQHLAIQDTNRSTVILLLGASASINVAVKGSAINFRTHNGSPRLPQNLAKAARRGRLPGASGRSLT